MRYLGLALFREGPTDYRFLNVLLRRAVLDVCFRNHARETVEIGGDVIELRSPSAHRNQPRSERILEAAKRAVGAIDLLFIHTDGGADPQRARRERIDPGADRVRDVLGESAGRPVAIVPVRETEAWAMVDGDALRSVFNANIGNDELGVPRRPREVEKLKDPKKALDSAYRASISSAKRRRETAAAFLDLLGEKVSLELLRGTPAYNQLEGDLIEALKDLRIIAP